MKSSIVSFVLLLFLFSCENGVVISYNPEVVKNIQFIKSEAVNGEELICDYSSSEHKNSKEFYVYFTMSGSNSSPVLGKDGRFAKYLKNSNFEFLKFDGDKDNNVSIVKEAEFVKTNSTPNVSFLIDLGKCTGASCSKSKSGFSDNKRGDFLSGIKNFIENSIERFDSDDSVYETSKFWNFLFSVFTVSEGVYAYSSNYGSYDNYKKYFSSGNNDAFVDKEYYEERHLFDSYLDITDKMKNINKKNQNLLLFLSGYDESAYETINSEKESEFINALDDANIPLYIYTCNDESCCKGSGCATHEIFTQETKNKLHTMACKTKGAYIERYYDDSWKKFSYNPEKFLEKIEYAFYGVWRIKLKIKNIDGSTYNGKIKFSPDKGEKPVFIDYEIIR